LTSVAEKGEKQNLNLMAPFVSVFYITLRV